MITQHLKQLVLAFAMLPLLVQPASAHTVWFDYKDGEYELFFGHPESGPETLEVSKFQSATAYDRNKQVVPVEINKQDGITVDPQGNIAALTAFYDNGYWVQKSPDDYENITQQQAEAIGYKDVTHNLKYTKAVFNWSEPISQQFGLPLEIMPQTNPFEVTAGETLPIKVLYQGNQIQDALVEYLGKEVDVNEQGIASIPIGEGGLQVIEASYDNPMSLNPVDSYATTFTAEPIPEPSALLGLGAFGLMAFIGKTRLKRSKGESGRSA